MVRTDQPSCFPENVTVAVSSRSDKTMLDRGRGYHDAPAVKDRREFCQLIGVNYDSCVFQLVQYNEEQTYNHLEEVTSQDVTAVRAEVAADGLFTAERGVGLFLPVADCTATVVYDPINRYIALLHLGRHATFADLSTRAAKYFVERGSRPEDLIVWMGPSAKIESYHLDTFDYKNRPDWRGFFDERDNRYYLDLPGYNRQRFIEAGVKPENITVSEVNTMTNENYFSHRNGDSNGRIAVVAMMR